MFEILVYAIALVVTVWFVEQRPVTPASSGQLEAVREALPEAVSEPTHELHCPTIQIIDRLESVAHTTAGRQPLPQPRLSFKDGVDIAELLEIGTWLDAAEPPAYNIDLPPAQLRALAEVYGVPCSKRGRIGAATLAQLAEVG